MGAELTVFGSKTDDITGILLFGGDRSDLGSYWLNFSPDLSLYTIAEKAGVSFEEVQTLERLYASLQAEVETPLADLRRIHRQLDSWARVADETFRMGRGVVKSVFDDMTNDRTYLAALNCFPAYVEVNTKLDSLFEQQRLLLDGCRGDLHRANEIYTSLRRFADSREHRKSYGRFLAEIPMPNYGTRLNRLDWICEDRNIRRENGDPLLYVTDSFGVVPFLEKAGPYSDYRSAINRIR